MILIGLAIAAPVGPIGLLCIRRSLVHGRIYGLVSGLGAATADTIYGFIAGFGLTAVSGFLTAHAFWLQLLGGIFMCYLGWRTLRSKPPEQSAAVQGGSLLKSYSSIFLLTITNPMTILSFAGIFAGLGLTAGSSDWTASLFLVGGVFVGSALWWLLLSTGVGLLRHRLSPSSLAWINRISGWIIMGFGFAAVSLAVHSAVLRLQRDSWLILILSIAWAGSVIL